MNKYKVTHSAISDKIIIAEDEFHVYWQLPHLLELEESSRIDDFSLGFEAKCTLLEKDVTASK